MPSVDDAAKRDESTPTVSLDKPADQQPAPPKSWAVPASVPHPGYPGQSSPPGASPYPGWLPPAAPPQEFNGFAIASAVLGVLGGFCCLWAFSIGFGIAALRQIPRRNQKGRGLAVTGLVASGLWLLVSTAIGVLAVVGHSYTPLGRNGIGTVTSPGDTEVFALSSGDCFDRLNHDMSSVARVHVVPCAQPHDGEVFASAALSSSQYPGKAEIIRQADHGCAQLVEGYSMDRWAIPDSVAIHFFYPDETSWDLDIHQATCIFVSDTQKRTGSLRRDSKTLTTDQLSYLQAVHHLDIAVDKQPDGDPKDSPKEYRAWAGLVADGLTEDIRQLEDHTWADGSAQPVAALLAEVKQAVPHWRAAQQSADSDTLATEIDLATRHLGHEQAKAARAALGLATGSDGSTAKSV